jgi:cytochrome c oxidase subunit 2
MVTTRVARLVTTLAVGVLALGLALAATAGSTALTAQAMGVTAAPSPPAPAAQPAEKPPAAKPPSGSVENGVRIIKMTAKKFEFTPNLLVVYQGEKVRLLITAEDGTHGFAMPDFNIEEKLEKGKATPINFTADKPGGHEFHCSIFCGAGHMSMKGELVVLTAVK